MGILSKSNGYQWDFSNQIPSNPMGLLSKSNGDHGVCQVRSYQIQWESSQNLMDTNGICQIRSDPTQSSN